MTAGAAAAAIAHAVKAAGPIVELARDEWLRLLGKADETVVIAATSRVFTSTTYKYLFPYRGLYFYTKTKDPIRLGGRTEVITAKRLWVPA